MTDIVSLSSSTSWGYPELTEDPKRKDKAYITQYGKALISEYMRRSERQNWYHGRAKYTENLSYARGEQDFAKFSGYFNSKRDKGEHEKIKPWERLHLKDLKIIPKYIRLVQKLLDEVQFDAICTPVDAFARNQKEEYAARLRFAMENAKFYQEMNIDPSAILGEEVPIDEDELQMRMDSFQNQEATDIEVKLAIALTVENDYDQIDKECDLDIINFGCCLFTDYVVNGRTYIKRIDPRNGIILPSRYEDHRDMVHGGYLETITVAELRAEAMADPLKDRLTESQIEQIARGASTTNLYSDISNRLGNPLDSKPIEVFRFQFKSKDQYVAYKNEKGIVRKRNFDYQPERVNKNAEVTRVPYNSVYEGTIVLGSEYSYGCRKMHNQKREMNWSEKINKPIPSSDCMLTLYAYAPNAVDGVFSCMMDEIKAPMDNIVRDYIKLNDVIARNVPRGYAINHAHLGNVVMQAGGKDMTKPELFNVMLETGFLNYSSMTIDGKEVSGLPITPIGYDLPDSVERYWGLIQNSIRLIEQITGVNDVIAGNNNNPEIGKKVAEIKVEAGVSSLYPYFNCKRKRFEAMVKNMGLRIQSLESERPVVGTYKDMNGQTSYVGKNTKVSDHIFQFVIENRPSTAEWDRFYAETDIALQNQQITMADKVAIRMARNLKQAYYILAARVKRNDKMRKAEAQQAQEMNAQVQMQASQASEQAKQATLQTKLEVDTQLETLKSQNARLLQQERYQGEAMLEEIRQGGKLEAKAIDGQNQIAKTVAKGETDVLVSQATETVDSSSYASV